MSLPKDGFYFLMAWVDALVRWYTRPRSKLFSIGKFFIITGVAITGVVASLKLSMKTPGGTEVEAIIINNDVSGFAFFISAVFTITGFFLVVLDAFKHLKESGAEKNILIEHMALFKPLGLTLEGAVRKSFGSVRRVKIDLTQYYKEGVLHEPHEALTDTRSILRASVGSESSAIGSEQVVIHYGGTPSVCFGFYSGFLIGNTTSVKLWDYDRDIQEWHPLDRRFDNNQPKVDCSRYNKINKAVCLIISISFDIEDAVLKHIPTDSIITIKMPTICHDNMSSLYKVDKFKLEFRKLLNMLNKDEIELVHIYCAAQSSFNFAMGQQITKNHPTIRVYEYVNNSALNYPWCLEFNAKEPSVPQIVSL
ncbi:SAVED domain-containing protein [Pseudoalteromonas luteoviolacea]|uniref:SMODS-associated and fused to various effectors domain-containing protein n=1 Tax=Pseudoalteromonas luteoviolacea S4060-1 TaxID=1365257 RepID=A0A167JAM9_9GAMM|nr:SAVED domain-containing protein [Pseudoalteromonas luteoviolacea]KZN60840.1 hypothetical protein N478_25890 [Pseudoalteromonas luteoviolacea S4060-1]